MPSGVCLLAVGEGDPARGGDERPARAGGEGVQDIGRPGALGTAYATSSPVLLVSGQIESYNLGKNRGALHEVGEQLDVFKHLTKWCQRTTDASGIPELVHTAMEHLSTGRPRPVEGRGAATNKATALAGPRPMHDINTL